MTLRTAASRWSVPPTDQPAEAERLAAAGVRHLHWDVTDGEFARAGGFDPDTASRLTAAAGVDAEVHLMVSDPLTHVDAWTDLCDLVVVHVEARGWREALHRIERRGARPAVALSPGTPTGTVPSGELATLVMSVLPGHGGSAFRPSTYDRLRALAGRRLLGVDGGVDRESGRLSRAAGATWLVSGTALLSSPDPAEWLAGLAAPLG